MIKAFFVDFYGTVVHEDGEVIRKITQIIFDTGAVKEKSEMMFAHWVKPPIFEDSREHFAQTDKKV